MVPDSMSHLDWLSRFFERVLQESEMEFVRRAFATLLCHWAGCGVLDFFYPLVAREMGAEIWRESYSDTRIVPAWTWPYTVHHPDGNILLVQSFDQLPYGDTEGLVLSRNAQAIGYFGDSVRQALDCWSLGLDVAWCNGKGILAFPHGPRPAWSIEEVAKELATKLPLLISDSETSQHDMFINAVSLVGKDLGYISVREYPMGFMGFVRLDCAWLSPSGEVFAAVEVETGGDIKKDIVSIWEAKPNVGIIVSGKKSKGLSDLCGTEALKSLPFPIILVPADLHEILVVKNGRITAHLPLELHDVVACSEEGQTPSSCTLSEEKKRHIEVPRFQDPVKARDFAIEVLGKEAVSFFEENGYLEVGGSNHHLYYIFDRIPAEAVGENGPMKWLVFGVDPRREEELKQEGKIHLPLEHFCMFDSHGFPTHTELVSLVLQVRSDTLAMLQRGTDPLYLNDSHYYPATDKMLYKIGKTLDEEDYYKSRSLGYWLKRIEES